MALVTLATNKPYLGLPRRPWDPILFGILLMGSGVILRWWLSKGTRSLRYGFTATRLFASEGRLISIMATASSALKQADVLEHNTPPSRLDPGGGRSGGAGASGSF